MIKMHGAMIKIKSMMFYSHRVSETAYVLSLDPHQYLRECAGDYVSIDKYQPHVMDLVEYYLPPILPEDGNRPIFQDKAFLECHILIG